MNALSWLGADGDNRLQVLWEDDGRVFCRGESNVKGRRAAVLVVLPAAEHPTLATVNRLAREYELKDELDGVWAVRPLELVSDRGRTMLVLEDPASEPLHRLLGPPMEVRSFLNLAIAVAAALTQVHRRGLVHKDIRPANILVNRTTGAVKLTGFGIASHLPRERPAPAPPESIAGSLAYMAPEQTGRMNRSVDARSDLYALGVTFYQMLTGSLPFSAADPMEWVHCHIARKPAAPSERLATVPAALSDLVLKLLAKAAEERYQTAAGLEGDLRHCLAAWEARHRIDVFPLGQQDTPDRLLIPEKLYGRERELKTLLAAFDRVVASGAPELVLVSGYSGVGKSSVINELQRVLVPPRGLFASGKFDQFKRDIPYATLAQAIQSLVRSLLGKSDTELGAWRDALLEALGPNGRLLVDLVPDLRLFIGEQPPVADLEPQQAQARFQLVLRRFISVFAQPEHPLALFLDDLQWFDAATLDFLGHLVVHSEVRHLLLVGAYRDNEVSPSHPLLQTLVAVRKAGARVQEIVLAPLGLDDVGQLVADAMQCEPGRARPMAQLVQEKTGGNPFFAIQFFMALAEEGLLAFDPVARAWQWNMDRIRAKSYTDNVVDLMARKLKRLSATTQVALKHLACIGNVVPIAILPLVHATTEAAIHAALLEAVQAGLIFREDSTYKFLHDRIQQAAYSLIPDEEQIDVHLQIGRALLASMTEDQLAEHLFDIANQLNHGAPRVIDRSEKAQVATVNLRAGRKAKGSAAFASARTYFAAAMAMLDEKDWGSRYELVFSVWLERAESEFLSGDFDKAEQLIAELLERAASKVDQAAACQLKVALHVMKSENQQAIGSPLTCLRLFGIDFSAHPTWEEIQAEYEMLWRNLGERPIEQLIDLPLMTDPEIQAALRLISTLHDAAYIVDPNLCHLIVCRMVNVSLQHGTSGASTHGLATFGMTLGPVFHRYSEGYRFTRLACDLVEKHGLIAYRARVHYTMGIVALWTQPIATAIDFTRTAVRSAIETGDLTYACYSMSHMVAGLLLRNDPLDAVWRESETALEFARKASFHDMADVLVSQQRFIAAMQGRTATVSNFCDAQFDEAAFEAQVPENRPRRAVGWYWILKLKARFLAGDYAGALAAADKAKALLWVATVHTRVLDYFYYVALAVAALYGDATADEQDGWRELLAAHQKQLREWAENCPSTFDDKYALVSAEIARIEGRDRDAMWLYEEAIRAARDNGFVQNEALAYEVAARFYAARGFEKIAHVYLLDARYGYLRWGAEGKVRQLDELYPLLRKVEPAAAPTGTIGVPVDHLDLATVIKVSQAVSSEMVLETLIDTVMRTAVEQAGAQRGLLFVLSGGELRCVAEGSTRSDMISVELRDGPMAETVLPQTIAQYVVRTREALVLDDAAAQHPFAADPYIRQRQARSILCLPLLAQAKLNGLLYLENNLTPGVFVRARAAVLKLLASQAAIALENASLYRDVAEREAKIRLLVDANIIGTFIWQAARPYTEDCDVLMVEANDTFLHMLGYDREDLTAGRLTRSALTPPEWYERDAQSVAEARMTGAVLPFEKEYLRKDGSRVPVLVGVAAFDRQLDRGAAFVVDLTERKRAQADAREAQMELRYASDKLAQATQAARLAELSASIAHEVNQPLAAIVANSYACQRWLSEEPPNIERAKTTAERIILTANSAADVVSRIRALFRRAPHAKSAEDVNRLIGEVCRLMADDITAKDIRITTDLQPDLPLVALDRVQVEQVFVNLIRNGIEAMDTVVGGGRALHIRSCRDGLDAIRVEVHDAGTGFKDTERVLEPFFTTKPNGMGMGLAICRSIIESHGGRLWTANNEMRGATVTFTLRLAATQAP